MRESFIGFRHLVRDAGVVEDALGSRRLTGIDMSHDADVPRLLERYLSGHKRLWTGHACPTQNSLGYVVFRCSVRNRRTTASVLSGRDGASGC